MLGGIINYEARHCYRESASRVKVLRNTYKSNTAITDHAHTERLLCFLIYLCFKVPKLLTRESHNTSKYFMSQPAEKISDDYQLQIYILFLY